MGWGIEAIYGYFALIALINLFLMRRPRGSETADLAILIPARDEAENLRRLIPALRNPNADLPVVVFDDESSDGTGEIAESLGARVLRPTESLPKGWTGKNRGCHELGLNAPEVEWIVFLDADVYPSVDFVPKLAGILQAVPREVEVVSGFPFLIPGRGAQPLFLAWVGWLLLATNPFGLVTRTGKGHNLFTNGQFHAWRRETYLRERPNEAVRDRVLEDVAIGRLLGKRKVRLEVVDVSEILGVKMYETAQQTLDGMSKNSFEIMGSWFGSLVLVALLLLIAWGWLAGGTLSFLLLVVSGYGVARVVRASAWSALILPVTLSLGAFTVLRSMVWKARGKTAWKGRIYP